LLPTIAAKMASGWTGFINAAFGFLAMLLNLLGLGFC